MKTGNLKISLILLVIWFTLSGSHLFAQTDMKDKKETKHKDKHNPPPPPPLFDVPPLNVPDLTPEQHEKLKAADLKHLEIISPLKAQIVEKKAKLVVLLIDKTFDSKQVNSVVDEIGKLKTEILKQQIIHDQELRGILTPAQKIYFDALPKPFLRP